MAPAHAIDGPDAHDHATKQLAPELTIDGPQQDGYSAVAFIDKPLVILFGVPPRIWVIDDGVEVRAPELHVSMEIVGQVR
ncbi:hypothetical protein CXR23_06060 [Brevibacterium aurantiacum]|uniref:Uncharacterized protein n=1 Tax=Brevibacterium aurantiacum TaxID=273384 RepID=A0A3Q9NU81_BREAU|nr:hypothetical protein CXR23_06060 [Brevibacterium aurantiacum]